MTEDDSTGGGKSEKRIIVANGVDLDKQYYHEVTTVMSRDRDLWKLSHLGPPLWGVLTLVGFAIAATGALQGVRSVIAAVIAVIDRTAPPFWLTLTLLGAAVVGILALLVFRIFVSDFVALDEIEERFFNLFNVLKRDVWLNLNYWHPFTSHLSDRDPIVPLSAGVEHPVSSIYSDGPHYQNVFVDALYIEPTGARSVPERVAYRLYKWGRVRRFVRRGLYAAAAVATLLLVLRLAGVIDTPSLPPAVSAALGVVLLLALVLVVLTAVAWNYLYVQLQFLSDSAGLSRYEQLLNPEDESILSRGEDVGLANSMNGYGVFYVSRFIEALFGRRRYDVALDPEALAPGAPEWETVIVRNDTIEIVFHVPVTVTSAEGGDEGGSEAFTIVRNGEMLPVDRVTDAGSTRVRLHFGGRVAFDGSDTIKLTYDGDSGTVVGQDDTGARSFEFTVDGDGTDVPTGDVEGDEDVNVIVERENEPNDGTAFPAAGFDPSPGDEHATAAAAEILWASLPADAIRNPPDDPDLTLALTGVDYYTIRQRGNRDTLVKETAGERDGYRLPVKKFMSVRHGFDAESLRIPDNPEGLLYAGSWEEDELHTLYVGGGEHQQAINKLLLVLKAEGYRNIDIRENAFAVGRTLGGVDRLRRRMGVDSDGPARPADQAVHLPIEYFVSLVSGGNEFFRQDDARHGHGFLLFRHELDTETDQREFAHVLIGMSAVGTKIGALFWQHLVTNEFTFPVAADDSSEDREGDGESFEEARLRALEEDVVYFFDAPGPTAHPICSETASEYADIGDLYTDTAWSSDGLEFDVAPLDEHRYERVSKATADPDDKTVGIEYFDLKVAGVQDDS